MELTEKEQFLARVAEVTREELQQPERWFYLSFAIPGKFLGVIVIKGHGISDCMSKTFRLNINPGGELLGVEIPDEVLPVEEDRNRLLSLEDCRRIWGQGEMMTLAEIEALASQKEQP